MEQKLRLWYKQPAVCHEETLPIGNGSLGEMNHYDAAEVCP